MKPQHLHAVQSRTVTLLFQLILMITLLLSGCGGSSSGNGNNDDNASDDNPDTVSALIGTEGGSITSNDGVLTLNIPEGAVSGEAKITISPVTPEKLGKLFQGLSILNAYELGPSGISFDEPVTVTVNYDSDFIGDDEIEGEFAVNLVTQNDAGLEVLDEVLLSLYLDQEESVLRGDISHFSPLVLTVQSVFDSIAISNVPDVGVLGETYPVKIRFRHFDGSELEADKAVYLDRFDDPVFEVIEEDQQIFTNDPAVSGFPHIDFGEVEPGVPNVKEQTVRYACKKAGITYFAPEMRYLDFDSDQEKYKKSFSVNAIRLVKAVTCSDPESEPVVQLVDQRDPEASTRAEWFFDVSPPSVEAKVEDTFSLYLNERGPFNAKLAASSYEVKIRDTNPGVISGFSLGDPAAVNGSNDIELGKGAFYFEERLNVDTIYIKDVNALLNTQKINFTCLKEGTTRLVFQLRVLENLSDRDIDYVDSEAVITDVTCSLPNATNDSDNDGVIEEKDLCPSDPGDTEHGCNTEQSNGSTLMGCAAGGDCELSSSGGSCSKCGVTRFDGSTRLISYSEQDTITISLNGEYTTDGAVSYNTELISGTAGEGAVFEFAEDVIECDSDESGQGCDGTFIDGSTLDCASDSQCKVQIIRTEEISSINALIRHVDVSKSSIDNDGVFNYRWLFTIDDDDFPPISGDFTIQTLSGSGTSTAQIYFVDDEYFIPELAVTELMTEGFELTDVTCDAAAGIIYYDNGFSSDRTTICQFVNTWTSDDNTALLSLPGATEPGEFNVIPDRSFGLPPGSHYVALGVKDGLMVLDADTGEIPTAGNDVPLNFSSIGFNNTGAYVLFNPIVEFSDSISSYGTDTITFTFLPDLGIFTGGILAFDVITDISHVGGELSSSEILRFNNGRNRIDALLFNSNPENLNWQSRTLIEPENLQNLNGNVISGFAWDLGRLDCYNPCQGSGAAMPSGCSAEIDQVISSVPSCGSSWTPTTCESAYDAITDNFCEKPLLERQVNFGGMILGVTDSENSELFLADPALTFSGRAQLIGVTGSGARRVECAGTICVVANYGSDTLTIVTWDGLSDASIVNTVNVGDGPISISIVENSDDSYEIFSTGSLNNTWHRTTVNSEGQVLGNLSADVIEGCSGPEDITWVPGNESVSDKLLVTCKQSDNYMRITKLNGASMQ